MSDWLAALLVQTAPAMLVTVAQADGSVPREAGAKMLVTTDEQFDTIGGGHLEWKACEFAREMLASPDDDPSAQRKIGRFALGPSLGQCCGGAVTLAFERIAVDEQLPYRALSRRLTQGEDSWRAVCLDHAAPTVVLGTDDCVADPAFARPAICHLADDAQGRCWLIDPVLPPRSRLYLFGAGHVGAAMVRALADLPCSVIWIDEREELFPANLPHNVTVEATDTPEALIDAAPSGASFLVMTHSHPLDQRLTELILRRGDFGWFGLIGSRTKRVQFERRLLDRGIEKEAIERMVCPIGMPGICSKLPAVIAASVAAQLLMAWEEMAVALGVPDSDADHAKKRA